jgi:uncharacterized protein (DUF2147 family)
MALMRFGWCVRFGAAAAALAVAMAAPAWAAAPPTLAAEGVWRNPKNSVHIELKPCGTQVCGVVVWASDKADAASRKASGKPLVGQQLMRNFVIGADNIGRGKVYIPDLNATFAGTAQQIDAKSLRARGCLFASVLCKSQVWTRIDNLPS